MPDKPIKGHSGRNRNQNAATIYDVANYAGVSKTTVSRVVNGEVCVRPETRALVHKAIKALRYLPNKAARNLASQTEARIGLLYNNPSVAYFSELLVGALEGSGRHGAQLVVDKCEIGNPMAASEAVRNLIRGGINGMILTAPLSHSTDVIQILKEEGIAIVGVATGKFRSDICCVGIDDFKAAYEMANYLIGLGHRKIGFVKGHPNHTSSKQRFLGFSAAMHDAADKVEEPIIAQGFNSYRSGLEAGYKFFSQGCSVTAIFASNDDMASGILSMAHRHGLSVPHDVSVVGFDDTIAGSVWPEMTTIRQPISDIGAAAVDVIVQNIHISRTGAKPKQQNYLIEHTLIVRESSAPPRGCPPQA
jgi:LacI family transcriptional regulator